MKYFICLIIILFFLLVVIMLVLAILMLYYHFINSIAKGFFTKLIYQISKELNISLSDIDKDIFNFIYFTDIYTISDFDYVNDKFFDILFSCKEKDKIENLNTESINTITNITFNDIIKDFREYNRYKSNNWNTKVKYMLFTIFSRFLYDFKQDEKDQKAEKILNCLFIVGLIIIAIKIILIFKTTGWLSLIFDLTLSCLYYILYYSLCKNYEWASTLHSFWLLDIFLLTLYDATHTELFSSFSIIFFLVYRIFLLIFIGLKILDYYSKTKFQKIDRISTLTLWKKIDLTTKNFFLWEMILVNIIANICMFASFMYPQISRFNLNDIMVDLNYSYEELSIIVCIYNSISNYFSLPLLQYSDTRIITINLLQNIVAFITNTFLFVKITQNLFGDDHKFANEEEMSLALCPECGEKISTKAIFCPNCGYPIKEVKTNVKKEKKDAKMEIDDT